MKSRKEFNQKIDEALRDFPPSQNRAQLINIRHYRISGGMTFAEHLECDHRSRHHAFRSGLLLVSIGAAEKINVNEKKCTCNIKFYDGSTI